MAWLSPAYPDGGFSFSSGLEWAVEAGDIASAATLKDWIAVMVGQGGGFADAVFFARAHAAIVAEDDAALRAVAELAAAFAPSKERHLETTMQGRAFVVPDDVKFLVRPVYRHRIILKPEAEIEGLTADAAMARVLAKVEVPR